MKRPYVTLPLLAVGVWVLAGCITNTGSGEADSKPGIVNRIYTARELQLRPSSCLYALTPEQIAAGKYVDVNVPVSNGYRIVSAFVPPSTKVDVGDEVQLSSSRCEKGAIPEVTRLVRSRR